VFDGYLRTVGRWTFNRSDVVFCYTDEDRERLRDIGVTAPVSVVANGIDERRFTPEGPPDGTVSASGFVVLFVGRLVEGKRPRDALDAFARLQREVPGASLAFAGNGPLRNELESRTEELGISNAVTFLGNVAYERMPAVYRSADVLFLPSEAEGLPRTVLEAFSSEVPAVTSDLKHIKPIVETAGKTAPVGDVSAFAGALRALADDESRRETMGEKGRNLVCERFTWRQTVEETTERLESLCVDGA
jgi:glycosyltransferase involved in cell wall biosynthesis